MELWDSPFTERVCAVLGNLAECNLMASRDGPVRSIAPVLRLVAAGVEADRTSEEVKYRKSNPPMGIVQTFVGWVRGAQPTGRKALLFGGLRSADPPYRKGITKQHGGLAGFKKQSQADLRAFNTEFGTLLLSENLGGSRG